MRLPHSQLRRCAIKARLRARQARPGSRQWTRAAIADAGMTSDPGYRELELDRPTPDGRREPVRRAIALETPIAVEINGPGSAVTMATPGTGREACRERWCTAGLTPAVPDTLKKKT